MTLATTLTEAEQEVLRAAVARGASWLDEYTGRDWRALVRANEHFDVKKPSNCVIGTVIGNYWNFLSQEDYTLTWGWQHGFDLPDNLGLNDAAWDVLQALWDDEVGYER